jgi:hypothetical protein
MRPAKQRQPKTGAPLIAGHDFSQRLYVPLKSMLEWRALLKKNRYDQLQGWWRKKSEENCNHFLRL